MPPATTPTHLRGYLTIGRAAEVLGVSAETLRNRDRSGKLKPARHPMNGYRLYRRKDLENILRRMAPARGASGTKGSRRT